ncbi:unnamed protein product [Peniophora sp. CBMAI 1063]|nr:unnamed protein product [Peniophora sp. CBMAI 1063]
MPKNSMNYNDECDLFRYVHDVYPFIDPAQHFATKTYKDKVIIITGGSTGIGVVASLFYAKAGAKVLIVARRLEKLEQCKADIEKDVPDAQVLIMVGDISDPEVGKRAVKTVVETYGRLDIVLANQFTIMGGPVGRFGDKDAAAWWHTQEVNVRGTINIIHPAISELRKTKGQIVVTTSQGAHQRITTFADYQISKHTLNRLVEFLALDYPELAVYAVHPGVVSTDGAIEALTDMGYLSSLTFVDTPELAAATFLWLTARNAEFLSGRYIEAPWDMGEVVAKKDVIVKDNLLVTKLAGPPKST